MSLIKAVVHRPVGVLMFVLSIVVLGVVSLINMPVELTPKMNLPMVAVVTNYPGAGPSEVETVITKKIESAVGRTAGIKTLQSSSSEGMSMVYMELEFGTNMNNALVDIREKVDMVKGSLPDEASSPSVMQLRMDDMPIMMLSASSSDKNIDLLYLVEEGISPEFESIAGVAAVDISGGNKKEIRVELDNNLLTKYGLSINSIVSSISGASVNIPAGSIGYDDRTLFLRGQFDFTKVKEIEELPITLPTGAVIKIADVAKVYETEKDATSISRLNGEDNISLSITKQQDANTVSVTKAALKKIEQLKKSNPDVHISVVMDQGDMIMDSIQSVVEALVSGALLAVLVLWLFLGSLKSATIIGLSIPFSLVMTFVVMYFSGIDLNIISLGGLVVGVGMMVDSSVVVLENIFQTKTDRLSYTDAAYKGTKTVATAVIAGALTTCVVYVPIVFIKGFTAEIFGQAALSILFSNIAALVAALTIVPSCYTQMKPSENKNTKFYKGFKKLEGWYAKLIDKALTHRKTVAFIAVACFVAGIVLIPFTGGELLPATDQGQYSVSIEMEKGKKLEAADEKLRYVESLIQQLDEIDHYSATVSGSASIMGGSAGQTTLNVYMKDKHKISTQESADQLREMTKNMTDCKVNINSSSSMISTGNNDQISFSIKGTDMKQLEQTTADLEKIMGTVKGVYKTSSTVSEGQPEARIEVDSLKAAAYGMTPAYIISNVSNTINGKKASTYKADGSEKDIYVRFPKDTFDSYKKLEGINIQSPTGASIPLVSVAKIVYDDGPVSIDRLDNQYYYSVTASYKNNDPASVMKEFNDKLSKYAMPYGVKAEFGGSAEMQNEAFSSLGIALLMALLLTFMVMAAQFESMKFSIVVMISVPFSISGAVLSLFVTGLKLSIPALIGMITLVGVVVNNAIVLIDWVNQLREQGMEVHEALVESGRSRLRPIMMTALTTGLGMLPLAFGIGQGGKMMQPMAVVTMGGLFISTLLTLVVVPVFYLIFENRSEKKRAKKQARLERKLAKVNG